MSVRASYGRPVVLVLIGVSVLYALIFAFSQHKLIYTDEVVFAEDILRISRADWASIIIPHPPLYTGLITLSTQIFGYSLGAIRLVGGLSFLLTLWLLPWATGLLMSDADPARPGRARLAAVIAILIWAVHPLALQGSLLLDIDNTVFTPAMLLFIIALAHERPDGRRVLLIALTFALMLWAKLLPTAVLMTGAALVVLLFKTLNASKTGGLPRWTGLFNTALGLGIGAALFGITLFVFASVTGFPLTVFAATFQRTGSLGAGGLGRTVTRGVMGGGITAVWIGIPFLLLFIVAVIQRLIELLRERQVRTSDMLWVCAAPSFVLLAIGNELPMGFPRYHYPSILLIVLFTSFWLARQTWLWQPGLQRRWLIAAATACAIYFAVVMPDPLLPQYQLTFETNDLSRRLRFGLQAQLLALVLPWALLMIVGWLVTRRARRAALAACVMFCAASWPVTTAAQTRAHYATAYEYGRMGGQDIADWVDRRTQRNDLLLAPKEILFTAQRPGRFIIDLVGPDGTSQAWLDYFKTHQPKAYVLTTKEDGRYTQVTRDARVQAVLDACYTERTQIGSYLAYLRSASCLLP